MVFRATRRRLFQVPCVFFTGTAGISARLRHGTCHAGCDHRYGTASFVTGTFGFVAAAHIVSAIAMGDGYGPRPD